MATPPALLLPSYHQKPGPHSSSSYFLFLFHLPALASFRQDPWLLLPSILILHAHRPSVPSLSSFPHFCFITLCSPHRGSHCLQLEQGNMCLGAACSLQAASEWWIWMRPWKWRSRNMILMWHLYMLITHVLWILIHCKVLQDFFD